MNMFNSDKKEYLTAYDIARELDMSVKTVYRRFRFKHAPERWKLEVRKDPEDGQLKYCVSRENFEKLWVGSQPKNEVSKTKKAVIKQQSLKP